MVANGGPIIVNYVKLWSINTQRLSSRSFIVYSQFLHSTKAKMSGFFNLRRDLDSLFTDPFYNFDLDDYNEMRRRALDLFDSYYPWAVDTAAALPSGEQPVAATEPGATAEATSSTAVAKPAPKKQAIVQRRPWNPRCDMVEKENEVIIHAEVPGLTKDEIKLDYDEEHNVLSISGEKKSQHTEDKDTEQGKFHYMERSYGTFMRSFKLPAECKEKMNECQAVAKDGVLEIHCPKAPAPTTPKTRSITVN